MILFHLSKLLILLKQCLNKVFAIINMENKDAEITEFTENISILYTKRII